MMAILLATGIRLSELVGLDVSDVDLEAKRLTIHAKGGNTETRFLNTHRRRELRKQPRRRAELPVDTSALFLSALEQRISARQVQARLKLWLQWACIDRAGMTVHSTRHTFGTRLYQKTHDLVLVGKARAAARWRPRGSTYTRTRRRWRKRWKRSESPIRNCDRLRKKRGSRVVCRPLGAFAF